MASSSSISHSGHPPPPRRMRRSRRKINSGGNNLLAASCCSGFELYGIQGDAAAALAAFREEQEQQHDDDDDDNDNDNYKNAAAAATKGSSEQQPAATARQSHASRYNGAVLSYLVGQQRTRKKDSKKQKGDDSAAAAAAAAGSLDKDDGGNDNGEAFLKELERLEAEMVPGTTAAAAADSSSSASASKQSVSSSSSSNNNNHHKSSSSSSSRQAQQRNQLILAHNRALVLHSMGRNPECAAICAGHLEPFLLPVANGSSSSQRQDKQQQQPQQDEQVLMVASRLALLLLECILSLAVGKAGLEFAIRRLSAEDNCNTNNQSASTANNKTPTTIPSVHRILEWLDGSLDPAALERDPQLKFLLQIYKSRAALADLDAHGKVADANIRSARKDMKIAMEIFQHKLLRPSTAGGGGGNSSNADAVSVVSSANSEQEVGSTTTNSNNTKDNTTGQSRSSSNQQQQQSSSSSEQQPPPPSSVVLQKLNQSALCLKAHLEQLKGNTKKSLILCSEAVAATTRGDDVAAYEALHSNNLAVIYETNNRRHLALHALAKSLRATTATTATTATNTATTDTNNDNNKNTNSNALFHRDGTARQTHQLQLPILHNAAVCALRARKFLAAYECLAAYLKSVGGVAQRRCWLRLAECCIGLFADLRHGRSGRTFSLVEVDEEPLGIVIEDGLFNDSVGVTREELAANLGGPEDLEQVQRNPLLRARAALERAILQENKHGDPLEADALVAARLSLAYVYLAFGEPRRALAMAQLVAEVVEGQLMEDEDKANAADANSNNSNGNNGAATNPGSSSSGSGSSSPALQRLRRRQAATARMYAAEASCALGELNPAMKYLVGDGRSDAFDRMASDLSGVTMETASTNGKGKRRLAKAQAMVRSSAGSVTAALGNPAAKQLANSATAMEDAYLANRELSRARRALIYTLLREGNHSTALSMLMSLR